MSSNDIAVDLVDASFGYDSVIALSGVTASIHHGDSVAIIGPNGSGKSTLLKGLLGLVECVSGSLTVLGEPAGHAKGRIGYLPQSSQRQTDLPLTVTQVVAMGLYRQLGALRPIGGDGKRRIQKALARVGLEHLARSQFGELSGGQQQRVILARALVSDPELLLFDEPFNGLDQPNRDALLNTMNELRATGVTILVSTHDLELARVAASHVMLVNKELIAFGPVEQALTLESLNAAFADATVEIDHHTLTTTNEIE